jgi:stress response protein YsnF
MLDLGAKPEQLLVNKNCVDNKSIRTIYDEAKINREETSSIRISQEEFYFCRQAYSF